MYRKDNGTEQHQNIALSERQPVCDAEQLQPCHRKRHADPHADPRTLFQKDTEYRHHHDVQRRDEPCLSDRRILNPDLLQIARHKQCQATADATCQQRVAAI